MKRYVFVVALFLVLCGWSMAVSPLQAQPYPNRPIQLVIPGPAGLISAGQNMDALLGKADAGDHPGKP